IELSESQGIPIGVLPDYQWEFKEIKLQANDILFIYTDVVLETRSLSGEEFGEQRLVSAIENSPSDPNLLVEHIQNALFEFSGRSELKDDLTLSAIRLL
ncbi:MAG: SpoIIE family protein phosphatase, partial [Kangiellaceae bacterium]